ncbi:hypothetical protein NP233_g11703 [Leucocoprinus birnbaumii]|uniref:Uncharacterized protein n=1 Tax=Leucocoprinus birnbaumii TaxID=56174 RepID=A0AAD5VIH4_9AGAR|nr:hypothetical protein NP233_g11703 [Leucocoprinus birnbaumii]
MSSLRRITVTMHFSKTYEELLGTLPRELRETTVEYKHLKKIINQIVQELSSLGLNPGLLQELLEYHEKHPPAVSTPDNQVTDALTPPSTSARVPGPDPSSINSRRTSPTVVYEFSDDSSRIESRLRVPTESLSTLDQILHSGETEGVGGDGNSENEGQDHDGASKSEISNFSAKLTKVINGAISAQSSVPSSTGSSGFRPLLLSCEKDIDSSDPDGVIIPLASDIHRSRFQEES